MEPRLPVNPAVRPGPPAGQAEPFRYRLGLDLGSNSIGWCVLDLDAGGRPCGVRDAGVRILSPNEEAGRDPQSKTSLAAERRDARSARRRRGRFVRRRDRLMGENYPLNLMLFTGLPEVGWQSHWYGLINQIADSDKALGQWLKDGTPP